uniref:non-specific serine/threonine protein kinase n=1 Tax=Fagus sylvatica TaxID=28930 RepID=A0A2N9I386_FAGSY
MGLSHWSSAPPSSSFSMHAFNLLLWCGFLVTSVLGGNNETDRLALLEFKAKITLDPFGVMSSWNDSIHFCQWRGVTCGRRHQRVTVLGPAISETGVNQIQGRLPSDIETRDVAKQIIRKKRKENSSSNSGNMLLNLSYQSLLNATDGFSSTNLIGVGSFGSVYKGILDQGRHTVAVKGIDYQGHDFKALVMEFMGNGNLDEWLHPTPRINETLEEPRGLSLLQRLNIAIDVANALDYLHHHCQTPIVHCDLKPSNVLLDDEMIGHVGDFGLARFLFDATQDSSIDQSSSIGVRGTVGYTPPEYGLGNEVSTYGDVYSYGILLLEMFTGKRPTDNVFQDCLNLHDFVKAALSTRITDIIDPILFWEREEGETTMNDITRNEGQNGILKSHECLISILEVGVACSVEFPRERMNMSAVIIQLHSIRQKLIGTNIRRQRLQATGAQG